MLGGPTVRRIHREREQREASRRDLGDERSSTASAGGHHSVRFRMLEPAVAGRAALPLHTAPARFAFSLHERSAGVADRAACPLRMADILGLESGDAAAVIDGDLVPITKARVGGRGATYSYEARSGDGLSDLATRVDRSIHHQLPAIEQWARTRGANGRYAPLDRHGPRPSRQSDALIARFVHERLIPALEQGDDSEHRHISRSRITISHRQVLPRLERSFAFVGSRWYELVPLLRHTAISPGSSATRARSVSRNQSVVSHGDAATVRPHSRAGGGRDPRLRGVGRPGSVRRPAIPSISHAGGRYFLSRRISQYAIEGRDRKLYCFGEAEFGIQIAGLRPAEVITPYGVRVFTEHYPHMFVDSLGGALVICMPRSQAYFRSLFRLPLEEALQRHLESARLTLCAGYVPENSLLHPIHVLGRKTISEGEALLRQLPVYRYSESTWQSTAQRPTEGNARAESA